MSSNLMAAASDLLDALRACQGTLHSLAQDFNSPYFTDRHGDGPRLLKLVKQVDAAIAKAEAR